MNGDSQGGFGAALRRLTRQITEAPVGWPAIAATLVAVAFIRTVLELLLDTEHTVLYHGGTFEDLLTYANALVSWLATALLLGLILKRFLGLDTLRAGRLVSALLTVTWLVPPINWLATGGAGANLYYGHDWDDLLFNLLHLFDPTAEISMAPVGVRVEIFLVTVACLAVAPVAFGIGRLRAVGLALSVYGAVFALGYLPAFYTGLTAALPADRQWEIETVTDFYLIYVPLLLMLGAWLVGDLLREGFLPPGAVRWLLYPSRLGFYLFLVLFGFAHATAESGPLLELLAPADLLRLLSTALSVALLFAWARVGNDVHDLQIDQVSNSARPIAAAKVSPNTALRNARILLFSSGLTIVPAGATALPLWGLVAALCLVYSSPPLRLRRFYPLGLGLLAMIGVAVFALGASLVVAGELYGHLSGSGVLPALFAAFFFLGHLKDLKDIEGDRAGGVYNVFHSSRWRRGLALAAVAGFMLAVLSILPRIGLARPVPFGLTVCFLAASLWWIARVDDLGRAERVFALVMALIAVLSALWLGQNLT